MGTLHAWRLAIDLASKAQTNGENEHGRLPKGDEDFVASVRRSPLRFTSPYWAETHYKRTGPDSRLAVITSVMEPLITIVAQ